MKTKLLIAFLLSNISITLSQNLLDTSTWTVGSGAVTGFSNNGTTTENGRELGENHLGKTVLLWKASPDNISNADGGWNTDFHAINHILTYQFTIWLKVYRGRIGKVKLPLPKDLFSEKVAIAQLWLFALGFLLLLIGITTAINNILSAGGAILFLSVALYIILIY